MKIFSLLFFLIFTQGCGYQLAHQINNLSREFNKIAIPIFANKTGEPGLEQEITQNIRKNFIRDGRLKVVQEKQAELLLTGEITRYNIKPLSFDSQDKVIEYNVEMDVSFTLIAPEKKINILEQNLITKWDYKTEPDIALSETFRFKAISNAAKDLSERLVSMIIDGF